MKREYWILLLITSIAILLRFASLLIGFAIQANFDTSIFPDEATFLVSARYFLMGTPSPYYVYYHNSLILSPLISGLYSLFGTSAFAGRFLSASLGAFTVPLTYFLAKELFKNEKKALLAALFLSISFIHRFWTMRALADGPLTFFFVLSIYLFIRAIHSENLRWYILAGIATTITIFVKYPGVLIYPIIFVYLIISIYLHQIPKRSLFYYFFTVLIFAFTIITLLLSQFVLPFQPLDQITYFLKILFSGASNPFYYIFSTLELNFFWGLFFLGLIGIVFLFSIKHHSEGDLLLFSWLSVVFIFFSLYGASELYRYLIPAFPAFYILISHFFIEILKKYHISIYHFQFSRKSIVPFFMVFLMIGLITTELTFGEYLILKRSTTYGGVFYVSTWLNRNGTQGAGIMAPSNALAQLEFYTKNNFMYFGLSMDDDPIIIWNYVLENNISYILLSEHFPETFSLPIWTIIPADPFNYSLIFTYSEGIFDTFLYQVIIKL